MKLPSEKRDEYMLMYEGATLRCAGESGRELGADYARCVIDGTMNALIKIGGAEEAARFAFQLSDRVVGRLRAPTDYASLVVTPPPPAPSPELEAKINDAIKRVEATLNEKPKPQPMRFWSIFGLGWLVGFIMGSVAKP